MADDLCNISHNTMGRTTEGLIDPETGLALEESVPPTGVAYMYNKSGDLMKIPTRCHRAPASSLVHFYWPRVLKDMLEEQFLQGGVCPHTPREQLAKKGKAGTMGSPRPSMPPPKGYTFCDGSGEWVPPWRTDAKYPGCEHMQKAVIARHRKAVADAKGRRSAATLAGAKELSDLIAKQAIVNANANAVRDKGAELVKAPT